MIAARAAGLAAALTLLAADGSVWAVAVGGLITAGCGGYAVASAARWAGRKTKLEVQQLEAAMHAKALEETKQEARTATVVAAGASAVAEDASGRAHQNAAALGQMEALSKQLSALIESSVAFRTTTAGEMAALEEEISRCHTERGQERERARGREDEMQADIDRLRALVEGITGGATVT